MANRCWSDEPLPIEFRNKPPAVTCQACDLCADEIRASDDGLRVRGWLVFDGRSETGKELHVRVCPDCRRKGTP